MLLNLLGIGNSLIVGYMGGLPTVRIFYLFSTYLAYSVLVWLSKFRSIQIKLSVQLPSLQEAILPKATSLGPAKDLQRSPSIYNNLGSLGVITVNPNEPSVFSSVKALSEI
jgi:uncharacterized membrane protein